MTGETNRLTGETRFGTIPAVLVENDVVFHYTRLTTAFEKILYEKKIRLSPLSASDDPFEQLANGFPGGFDMGQMGIERSQMAANREIGRRAEARITERVRRVRFMSFCKNGTYKSEYEPTNSTKEEYGFLKQRMWSQYAEHSTGVCLAFSKSKLTKQAEEKFGSHWFYAGDIDYQNFDSIELLSPGVRTDTAAQDGEERFINNWFNAWHEVLFLTKHFDYQGENEFRIAVVPKADDLDDPFLDIGSALIGVVVNGLPANPYIRLFCECARGICPLYELLWEKRRVSVSPVDCETGRH